MDIKITSYHSEAKERKVILNTVNKKIKRNGIPFTIIKEIKKGNHESCDYTLIFDEKDIPKEYTDEDILETIGMESYYTAPGYSFSFSGLVKRKNGKIICSQNGGLDI